MFFDRERTGVELHAKKCDIGNEACPGFANRESYKEGYDLFKRRVVQHEGEGREAAKTNQTDRHRRVSEEEYLV